jgi:hypothetical protein
VTFASLLTEFFTSRGTRDYVGRHREPRVQRYVAVAPVRSPSSDTSDDTRRPGDG